MLIVRLPWTGSYAHVCFSPFFRGFSPFAWTKFLLLEGYPILITCSSRESGDSSGETGLSRASREVVNVRCFSEKT